MGANLGKIRDLKLENQHRGWQTVDHRPNSACCPLLLIKFYWYIAMPVVYILSAAISSSRGDLSSCSRDPKALRAPCLLLGPLQKIVLLTPGLGHYSGGTNVTKCHSLPPESRRSVFCSVEP